MSVSVRFGWPTLGKATMLTSAMLVLFGPAKAADLGPPPMPLPPVYNWTGFYVGVNFGGVFNIEDVTTPLGVSSTNPSGALGGGQFGYNYQFSSWLVGLEGEFDGSTAQGTTNFFSPVASTSVTSDQIWYGTLSGRLGYVMGPLLVYGKAGGAWINGKYDFQVNSGLGLQTSALNGASSISSNRSGWNVGGGVEYIMSSRWSAKVEYDYLDFGSTTFNFNAPFAAGSTIKTQASEIKAGLNYRWAL